MSKVSQKIIFYRLTEHLAQNNLMNVMQSAYHSLHSTETALLKVQNIVLSPLNEGSAVVLLMSNRSAAFDTIAWFKSYLFNKTQCVNIKNGVLSDTKKLTFGVPQGSVQKNLGVTFNQTMSMQPHLNSISSSCHYIRKYINIPDCKRLSKL